MLLYSSAVSAEIPPPSDGIVRDEDEPKLAAPTKSSTDGAADGAAPAPQPGGEGGFLKASLERNRCRYCVTHGCDRTGGGAGQCGTGKVVVARVARAPWPVCSSHFPFRGIRQALQNLAEHCNANLALKLIT